MALNSLPLPGQSLAVSRNPIKQNFDTINAAFAIDHVTMTPPGTAAPQGFHNKVTFPVQGAAPVFGAGIAGLFNLLNATTAKNELNVHKQNQAGAVDVPFTASVLSNNAIPGITNGWSYLPSGILIKWGVINANGAGTATLNLNSGGVLGPNFTRMFCIQGSAFNVQSTFTLQGFAPATITLTGGSGQQVYFFVIGA